MDKVKFVQNVKLFCERKGEKVTPACKAAGVGTSFINNIEARGQIPSVEKVQMLAQYLGCTVSELLGESIDRDLAPAEHWLLDAYASADRRTKEIVEQILEPFAKKKTTGAAG